MEPTAIQSTVLLDQEHAVSQPPVSIHPGHCPPTRRDLLKLGALGLLVPTWLTGCGDSGSNSGNSGSTPDYSATIADARIAIQNALSDSDTPSISVALVERDRIIWAEAFGIINKATTTAASTETLFCIGSCSKMLATLAVMMLSDRGLVRLDEPLVTYLPGFNMASPDYTRITVRMLLNHSSGFPGFDFRDAIGMAPRTDYAAQVMQTLAKARLKHAPGEMSVYCNDGFTLVELLVQTVTGQTYPQFITQNILLPLGMTRSRFATEPFAPGSFAPGYDSDMQLPQEFPNIHGSGGLYSTPTEMASLARMLLNQGVFNGKQLLSTSAIAEMARNQTSTQPLQPVVVTDGYGLGWDGVHQDGLAAAGVTAWHKNGGTFVYGSDFFVLPDEGLALMITGTSTAYRPGRLAERILLQALVERGRLAALPLPLTATSIPAASESSAVPVAPMAGVYAAADGIYRLQTRASGTVAMSNYADGLWADDTVVLKMRDDGFYSSDAEPFVSYRPVLAQGRHYLTRRTPAGMGHYLRELPWLQKLDAKASLSVAWQNRLGRHWLIVNEPASSWLMQYVRPALTLSDVPDLPGYIVINADVKGKENQIADASTSDHVALMCLKIPVAFGRDLDDVVIIPRAGEEWARVGSGVFRPAASVAPLVAGASVLFIGTEGYAEWRSVAASAIAQTITLLGATAWKLYDSEFTLQASGDGSDRAQLPAHDRPCYLLVYGSPNAVIRVRFEV